jgi:hypothetical protein
MTDLELALSIAFGVMFWIYISQRASIRELRSIIFAVAEKKARIEIDEENKIVRIVNN